MKNESELRIMQNCFIHHWNTYPTERGRLFKVKNEGTNRISGARDKATGLLPGVSDMILLVPTGKTVFLEFKTETGRQSDVQKQWQSNVESAGFDYHIIRSLEDFIKIIEKYYCYMK